MNKTFRFTTLAIVLSLTACLDKCGDKPGAGEAGTTSGANEVGGKSLILAAQEQGAFLPPELADERLADEKTLPMTPFSLPASDLSAATPEAEPNNTAATASQMGPQNAARGEIGPGDVDQFTFETTGDAQLWAIEAVGKNVRAFNYHSPSNTERAEARQLDSTRLVIANLFLAAGKHGIEVHAASFPAGPYTIRAIPLGKPDLRMEREPNDTDPFAESVRPGIPRVGFILHRSDHDAYSFSLREASHVMVQVTSPPDLLLMATVSRTIGPAYTFSAKAKGEDMRMDVVLPPGDYITSVRSNDNGSLTPYKLRVDILDPFVSPVDAEPNNDPAEAAPLPADLVLRGTVGEFGDRDWYRIPTLSSETIMRIQVVRTNGTITPGSSIQVINRTGDRDQILSSTKTDSVLETRLPANAPLFIQLSHRGDYELKLSFTPGISLPAGKGAFTVSLPAGPHLVEAFSTRAQSKAFPVTVHNPGSQPIQVTLDAVSSHSAWSIVPAQKIVSVGAGKRVEVPFQLILPPDEGSRDAVQIAVRGSSAAGSSSATTSVYALCAAAPASTTPYSPLPPAMLGGLNLASASLGGRPVAPPIKLSREAYLYDGLTPSDVTWTGDRTASDPELLLTVALAGNQPAMLRGISLVPGIGDPDSQVDRFDVLVSEDGQAFRQVMSGRLRLAAAEQSFAFPEPVRARFAQLRIRSNQTARQNSRSTLAEWKVIGAPGETPFAARTFNIADPKIGGHVVWSRPLFAAPSDAILKDSVAAQAMKLNPSGPSEWVVGFRHNRAAQISRLEWLQPTAQPATRRISRVEVAVSTESPNGPWTPVGTWKIDPAASSTSQLDLTQPVWARFVRFSTTEPKGRNDYWRTAESIRIYERESDATYRSVLGEWGHYARSAIYEQLVSEPVGVNPEEVTGNGKRSDAKKAESGKGYRGRVIVGEDEDWYRIEIPKDHNKLKMKVQGDPMLRAVATLQDESGKAISAVASPGAGGLTQIEADVAGGATYFLRLAEPPRSIAIVWDNSPSIRNYWTPMYRALTRMVETVQPGREFVNLLPFRDDPKETFLLSSWSDQASALRAGIHAYARGDASSDVEFSLLTATKELAKREGSKAIFLITDALSPGYPKTAELWEAFSRVPVRVFSVELQLGNLADPQQRMMQDLADANAGYYTTFRSGDAMDAAFDRTSCYLRRPAQYAFTFDSRFEVPAPPSGIESMLAKSGRVDIYGIYFDVGSAALKTESGPVLKEISDALVKNPAWKLGVEGHTDDAGDDAGNMSLSRARAAAVKEALVKRFAISEARLTPAGFGESKPKESNGSARGRALNRRVELIRK